MCEAWSWFVDNHFIMFSAKAKLFHILDSPGQIRAPSVCPLLFSVSYYDFPELLAFIYSGG